MQRPSDHMRFIGQFLIFSRLVHTEYIIIRSPGFRNSHDCPVVFAHVQFPKGLYFKRGSVQPGCILGGLRFRSTAIRFFKCVWYF
jgi:hypothetical protein